MSRRPFPVISRIALAGASLVALGVLSVTVGAAARQGTPARPSAAAKAAGADTSGPPARPLRALHLDRGLQWLADRQRADGSWSDGFVYEGEATPEREARNAREGKPDVALSSLAAMAFVRAGHTPAGGRYAAVVRRAVDFVLGAAEAAPDEGLGLSPGDERLVERVDPQPKPGEPFKMPEGVTESQQLFGAYADTFLAATLLAEASAASPGDAADPRLARALDKLVRKIETAQQPDGRWAVFGRQLAGAQIGEAVAVIALHRAARAGTSVDPAVLARARRAAAERTERQRASPGQFDRHVKARLLASASLSLILQGGEAAEVPAADAAAPLPDSTDDLTALPEPELRRRAGDELRKLKYENRVDGQEGADYFIQAFVGQAVAAQSRNEAAEWDRRTRRVIGAFQNSDGSWVGRHCLRGRTFCTASALLAQTTAGAATRAQAGAD